ncbi:enoyl-CoA hydratase/isomerase family protein [Phycicoccus endophyticus]|uniref:Enoyl-CoA hydratase/isomerase family protein n=1 Tax=Phycicoccus endophyticus TaxID=1690220 RepID=A0A7G9R3R1_9MICO|nr:enoyl-CoA hydratase-related protein [Phycicoccus endophyticus]NHI18058.1 enoyl-CoA hydratase [Phycicoccus endophyticus]QNN50236.1 enoyl-CoA hydratase/isomerase family protein [Phycicoccus endophyticus]GGL26758.1 putative enoyl-CoA hydratase echA6 [Phycicoccus endophyticus]
MSVHAALTDHVAVLTIDRTHRRNALDLATLEELHAAVVSAVDAGARALVVTGAEGHFCAGADLTELEDVSFTRRLAEVLEHLAGLPLVTVAAVEGSCMGLGMQLALACDVRVVADSARFAVPVARLGLMVDHWTLDRLARVWGEGAARHLVLTAAVLDAEDAWRLGFTQVRGGLEEARTLAQRCTGLAPLSQAGSKLGLDTPHDDAPAVARYEAAFARAWASEDLTEGRAAFAERREPRFRGH